MQKRKNAAVEPGLKMGKLTILEFHHSDFRNRKFFVCQCDCGNKKVIHGAAIVSGNTKSCGCLMAESARKRALPHGISARNLVFCGYRHKAKEAGIPFTITKDQFSKIVLKPCFYCGIEVSNVCRAQHGTGDFAYNGLDKIDPRKGYSLNNVVPACRRCNIAKSNRSQGEFIAWIGRAFLHLSKTAMADQWT